MEGVADLLFSLSKLVGGWVGRRTEKKRGFATLGYLLTAAGTGALALAQSAAALISFRAAAWFGRGFRSPLRDFARRRGGSRALRQGLRRRTRRGHAGGGGRAPARGAAPVLTSGRDLRHSPESRPLP